MSRIRRTAPGTRDSTVALVPGAQGIASTNPYYPMITGGVSAVTARLAGSVAVTTARPARRHVLAAALGTGALALGVPPLAGCAPAQSTPPAPDPLEPLAEQAEIDVRLATAVADAHPDLVQPAAALASDRRQHAAALRAELRRARPAPQTTAPQTTTPQIGAPSSTAAPPPVVAPLDPADARAALAGALQTAQDMAAALVAAAPGHRAALLASITACCASHQAVLP